MLTLLALLGSCFPAAAEAEQAQVMKYSFLLLAFSLVGKNGYALWQLMHFFFIIFSNFLLLTF